MSPVLGYSILKSHNNLNGKVTSVEKRYNERMPCHLNARIVSEDKTYDGFIENASESGIGYLITSSVPLRDELEINDNVELHFQISSDDSINLNCEVVWTKRGLFSGKTIGIGINIINPPSEYKKWIRNLLISSAPE